MNKEAAPTDLLYNKLDNLLLLQLILKDPVAFSKTKKGKLLHRLLSAVPSSYNTLSYKIPDNNLVIKIVFTGMGDGLLTKHSIKDFKAKYGLAQNIFFFGWPQYQEAMIFASRLNPQTPIEVYGHSWGSNAARKFILNYLGNIIKGYFFDPMRRNILDSKILTINKDIPIIYTPIVLQPRKLNTVLHKALRWMPSLAMQITLPASGHTKVILWLNILDKPKEVKKVANFLLKYGSYSLCLTKVAQQKNTKKVVKPKMHSKLTWQPQADVSRLNLYNNINLFLNAVGDTLTQHKNLGIIGKGIYRRGSAYHIQQQALDDINNMLTLPQYKKRIESGELLPKYTLDLIHNNGEYAKQAALLYINGRVMPKVQSKFKDKSLTLDRALRDPNMRLSVYFYYTFGSDPRNRKEVNRRLGHFNAMYDLLSRRMQYQYNQGNPKTPMSLYNRKFLKDKGGRYFMYTLRPNQAIMKLGRNANHTLKILKDSGFSGFQDPKLSKLPMGYRFKYYVADNYNDYY